MKRNLRINLAILLLLSMGTSSVFAQTIYTEDFTGLKALPTGWSQTTLATDGGWKVGTAATISSTDFGFVAHGTFIATNDDSCKCNKSNDFLKTGSIDLRGHASLYLSFQSYYYHAHDNSGHTESATIKASADSGATWTVLDSVPANIYVEWVTRYVNLSAYAGDSNVMIGFDYGDGGGTLLGWGVDSVSIFVPLATDLDLVQGLPTPGTLQSFAMPGTQVPISFVVFNNSKSTVTTFAASYTVDGVTTKQSKFYVNIGPYSYDTSAFNISYTVPAAGSHNVTIVVSLAGDVDLANDTTVTDVEGGYSSPTHTLVLEDATGCWCGYCPASLVFMDSIAKLYPGNPALIAVHDDLGYPGRDAMAFEAYDLPLAYLLGDLGANGYPTIFADRKSAYDPAPYVSNAFPAYSEHINDYGVADMSTNVSFDSITRKCTVEVTTTFAVNTTNANATIACVFTEDGVHGTTSDYNQENYYSKYIENFPLHGAGINWQQQPESVPASIMYYNDVARTILGGFTGITGSFPYNIVANKAYTYTFSYTIPSGYVESNMKVIALLINPSVDQIYNASSPQAVTGINDVRSNVQTLSLYPNPAANELNVLYTLSQSQSVTLNITDMTGRVVYTKACGNIAPSNQEVHLPINNLAAGVYLFNIQTDGGTVSRKFIKN